jgi:hypothetical protein
MADPKNTSEHKSAFALAIEEAEKARPVEPVDLSGFFGLADRPLPRVGIRVPTITEQNRALVAAHVYVDGIARESESAKADLDILHNAKQAAIAAEFCRELEEDTENPGTFKPTGYPAFPAARWCMDKLDAEKVGVLVNWCNEIRAKRAPSPVELDDATVEAYFTVCSTADEPEYSLVGCTREYMVQLAILFAHKLAASRQRADRLAAQVALLEERLAKHEPLAPAPDPALEPEG